VQQVLFNCELCLMQETKAECRWTRWPDYRDHMLAAHNITVTRDGMPQPPVNPKPKTVEEL
jgi:hypothetical protein